MPAEQTWISVYRQTIGPLYRFASRRCGGDRELAEDVTQEAWLRAVTEWRRRGPPEEPLAWLKTVARNLLWNHFRRRRPVVLEPRCLDLEREDADLGSPAAATLVHWGLLRLSRAEARLLERFYLDGQGMAALAAEMGLSVRAVEGRLRRSREALRRQLAPYLVAEGSEA